MDGMIKIAAANDNSLKRDVFVRMGTPNASQLGALISLFASVQQERVAAANDNETPMDQVSG